MLPGISMTSNSLVFTDGLANGRYGKVLRDTGCNMIGVTKHLIDENQYQTKTVMCKTITGSCVELPTAIVHIDSPYFKGETEVCVLPDTAVADIIIGNVDGVFQCEINSNVHNEHYSCICETRSKTSQQKLCKNIHQTLVSIHTNPEDFKKEQEGDPSLSKCFLKTKQDSEDNINFIIVDGFLYREKTDQDNYVRQLVVPNKFREDVLKLAHDIPFSGHQGMRRTKYRIQNEFYWPGMYKQINRYVRTCDICQKTSQKGLSTSKAPLQSMPVISIPFKRVAIDIIGPLVKSDRNNRYVLTIIDVATKWPECVVLSSDITAKVIAEALITVFSRVGFPSEILSDRGPQFISDVMSEVLNLIGIKHVFTSPYHPQANGLCERLNGTIKQMLKKVCDKHPNDWDRLLNCVLFAYREIKQDSTGFSPFELMYGRSSRGPLSILRDLYTRQDIEDEVKTSYQYVIDLEKRIYDSCQIAAENARQSAEVQALYADEHSRLRELKPQDKVLILLPLTKNKLLTRWQGPFEVVKRVTKTNYVINVKGQCKTFHINLLKQLIGFFR